MVAAALVGCLSVALTGCQQAAPAPVAGNDVEAAVAQDAARLDAAAANWRDDVDRREDATLAAERAARAAAESDNGSGATDNGQ